MMFASPADRSGVRSWAKTLGSFMPPPSGIEVRYKNKYEIFINVRFVRCSEVESGVSYFFEFPNNVDVLLDRFL